MIAFSRVGGANEISYNDTGLYGTNTWRQLCRRSLHLTGFNNTGPCFGIGNSNAVKFKNLRTKRNTVDADLVVLMRKKGAACGIAWQPDLNGNLAAADDIYGFSVVTSTKGGVYNCIEANTFAHETGHNQGLNHDRVQYKVDNGVPVSAYVTIQLRPRQHDQEVHNDHVVSAELFRLHAYSVFQHAAEKIPEYIHRRPGRCSSRCWRNLRRRGRGQTVELEPGHRRRLPLTPPARRYENLGQWREVFCYCRC